MSSTNPISRDFSEIYVDQKKRLLRRRKKEEEKRKKKKRRKKQRFMKRSPNFFTDFKL